MVLAAAAAAAITDICSFMTTSSTSLSTTVDIDLVDLLI